MLSFYSASVRIVNTERAVDECLDIAFGGALPESGVFFVNATLGHKLDKAAAAIKARIPGARVFGASGGGVAGREGQGETLNQLGIMAVTGPENECLGLGVDGVNQTNASEKAKELARSLKEALPAMNLAYLVVPGLNIDCLEVVRGFDEIWGGKVIIFGGMSSDNFKLVTSYQYWGDSLSEHGIWAVGFADPTLKIAAKATHGFRAYGDPMRVTKVGAVQNVIEEFDHRPAKEVFMERLKSEQEHESLASMIAMGALARRLPDKAAEQYGSRYILTGVAPKEGISSLQMVITVHEGDEFWLTTRDEDLIFSEQKKALDVLKTEIGAGKVAAVFQTDCMARGRWLFNKVMKDEIIALMQGMLSINGDVPPWLGLYGYGEFCPLDGKNTFHTYTTSLLVLYREA
jgi:hypothetical protein